LLGWHPSAEFLFKVRGSVICRRGRAEGLEEEFGTRSPREAVQKKLKSHID